MELDGSFHGSKHRVSGHPSKEVGGELPWKKEIPCNISQRSLEYMEASMELPSTSMEALIYFQHKVKIEKVNSKTNYYEGP